MDARNQALAIRIGAPSVRIGAFTSDSDTRRLAIEWRPHTGIPPNWKPQEVGRTVATKLLAISGPLRKLEFPLGAEVVIGRNAGNTIHLEDPTVSPNHCRISQMDGRIILSDLDSHSGTFVNGIPVKQRELKSGDEVAVGNSVFLSRPKSPRTRQATWYRCMKMRR